MSGVGRSGGHVGRVSLEDVARRAGVSVATASRALNGSRHPVATATRDRVLATAATVGYRPSLLGRALVSRRAPIIAIVVGDILDPYFGHIARGVEDAARSAGYLVMVCNAERLPQQERAYVDMVRGYHAAGLIFAGGGDTSEAAAGALRRAVDAAAAEGVRVFALATRDLRGFEVKVDNRVVSREMTRHLISLGHRRIAYLDGPHRLSTRIERLAGFREAMAEARLRPHAILPGEFDHASGGRAAARLLAQRLPDAVLGANDMMAIGLVLALRSAGVSVPGDVSVAGIDDVEAASLIDLTTVRLPLYEMGALAAREIIAPPTTAPSALRILPHRLVVRSTTGPR